jgi:electron transfer flavoprotein alpha subunit
MTTLLIADHDDARLNESTAKALSAAKALGAPVDVLVAGHGAAAVAAEAAALAGVRRVRHADDPALAARLAEPMADLVVSIAGDYDTIVAPAASMGKNVLPRVAALLDSQPITEVVAIHGPNLFERPIYAGNALQTVSSADRVRLITVRPASFPPAEGGGAPSPIESLAPPAAPHRSRFLRAEIARSERPELQSARIVVSGGRALGSSEKFRAVIEPFADRLGAAVGASRAAVDAGYAPNDYQVGQTGKVVAPDLYVAVGISGAIQHLAGMKDSKVIVAINKDPEAPIFQVADYGLVGDLFETVPEIEKALGG